MSQPLSGPGLGLQYPSYLYPSALQNAPLDFGNNYQTLAPGQQLPLPAGDWWVTVGKYSVLQYKDPITASWRSMQAQRGQPTFVKSDGFNIRIANLTGCVVGAVVTTAGSGYAQATTTVTPSAGNSTWQAIVGGGLSITSMSAVGAGYSVAPIVLIPAPPSPGVQATGYATIANGTVSGVTLTNLGAGYTTFPTISIQPNPTDPNFGTSAITQATVAGGLTGSGTILAIICTNPGTPQSTTPTLTITGAGSSAAATALRLVTLASSSVTSGGVGYTGGAAFELFGGGVGATAVNNNPEIEFFNWLPRQASGLYAANGGGTLSSLSTSYDGGLFLGTPVAVITAINGVIPTTAAVVTFTYGSSNDTVLCQPAP